MELKRRNKASAEFSMASMTDIIFLLLIFFMITSSAISQSALEVDLPKAQQGSPNVQNTLSVSINAEGKYFVNDVETPKDQLEAKIVDGLKDEKNPTFLIRADRKTFHGDVVYVMDIAQKHQYPVSMATIQEDE